MEFDGSVGKSMHSKVYNININLCSIDVCCVCVLTFVCECIQTYVHIHILSLPENTISETTESLRMVS